MDRHPIVSMLRDGESALGVWCEIPSVFAVEVVARCGFDWGCVDWQHGCCDGEITSAMLGTLAAHGVAPFVRVREVSSSDIGLALDIGAEGVIVPMVESGDQAAHASKACRYPPRGVRSIGPMRVSSTIGVDPTAVNARVTCVVMVETAAGLGKIGEIAAVDGVDAIFIGPGDLQLSLGGSPTEPLDDDVIEVVLSECSSAGVPAGIYAGNADEALRLADAGFALVAVSSDRELLFRCASLSLEKLGRGSVSADDEGQGLMPVLGVDFESQDGRSGGD